MRIEVRFFTSLREITGQKKEEVESTRKLTVKALLIHLSKRYGREFKNYVYDEKDNIRKYIQILVNGRGIGTLRGLETLLEDGDVVAIFPPVGGGGYPSYYSSF